MSVDYCNCGTCGTIFCDAGDFGTCATCDEYLCKSCANKATALYGYAIEDEEDDDFDLYMPSQCDCCAGKVIDYTKLAMYLIDCHNEIFGKNKTPEDYWDEYKKILETKGEN